MSKSIAALLALIGLSLSACSNPILTGNPLSGSSVTVKNSNLGPCANEVAEVKLPRQAASANFNTEFVGPGAFSHQYKVITIDTTGMSSGTLSITGRVGSGAAPGSFALLGASPSYPCTGFLTGQLAASSNIKAGESFALNHRFSSGQVFRFVAEGSWDAAKDAKNTVDLNFLAQ